MADDPTPTDHPRAAHWAAIARTVTLLMDYATPGHREDVTTAVDELLSLFAIDLAAAHDCGFAAGQECQYAADLSELQKLQQIIAALESQAMHAAFGGAPETNGTPSTTH